MRFILIIILAAGLLVQCRDKKEETPKMMPVEADGGIGDGAEPLDSILKRQEEALEQQVKDSL